MAFSQRVIPCIILYSRINTVYNLIFVGLPIIPSVQKRKLLIKDLAYLCQAKLHVTASLTNPISCQCVDVCVFHVFLGRRWATAPSVFILKQTHMPV